MSGKQPITTSSIKDICEKFGFEYEVKEEKHLSTIAGKEVEITFKDDGTLPPGKHLFMTVAREASEAFRDEYPVTKRSSSKPGKKRSVVRKPKVVLDRKFLGRFSIEKLDAAWNLIGDLVKGKRNLARLENIGADKAKELEKLRKLVGMTKEMEYPLPDGIEERIGVLEGEVGELNEQVEKQKEQIESGQPPQDVLAGSVPAGSAAVATDESKEPPEPQ